MFGRSISMYNFDPFVSPRRSPVAELFHDITLDEALEVCVQIRRVEKTLGWIARNRPFLLESLMDSSEPGTRQFSAICCVYSAFESRIKTVTGNRNRGLQQLTKEGLRRSRKRKGTYRARPSTAARYALQSA